MEEKLERLKEIDSILVSKEVAGNTELQQVFSKAKKAIENDEAQAIGQLSQNLSLYLMMHQYKAPKNVIEFATKIAKEYHRERGKISTLNMLAMSLHGLK